MLTTKVFVPMHEIGGGGISKFIENLIKLQTEGKCIAEGYVCPNSVNIVSYSAGMVVNENIEFAAVYECNICHPVEGMLVECKVKTITKAGIHAVVPDEKNNVFPITVFIARDHHYTNEYFNSVKEDMNITARVIGVRYELNDKCVYVIAEIVENGGTSYVAASRRKIGGSMVTIEADDDEE